MLLLYQEKLLFLHQRAGAVYFLDANQGMRLLQQSKHSFVGGEGKIDLRMGGWWMCVYTLLLSCRSLPLLVIKSIKENCLLSAQIPLVIWLSLESR